MSLLRSASLLRIALLADAAASGATGLLMAAGAGTLTDLLGLPENLLRSAGLVLLPFAAGVAWLGTRATISRGFAWTVVAVNAAWVFESAALLLTNWVAPTALGYTFVLFQAAAVLALAEAQFIGLRRAAPRAVATVSA